MFSFVLFACQMLLEDFINGFKVRVVDMVICLQLYVFLRMDGEAC